MTHRGSDAILSTRLQRDALLSSRLHRDAFSALSYFREATRAGAPQLILIGVPKAGTSALHECLTSGTFTAPAPCCSGFKEPFFFLDSRMLASLQSATSGNATSWWPRIPYSKSAERLLLDFTPNYLHRATVVASNLRRVYGTQPPRFAILLRNPVARALSNYCFWAPSPSSLAEAVRNGMACQDTVKQSSTSHPRDCWSKFRLYLRNANLTEAAVAARLPGAASAAGTLNYSRAAALFQRGNGVRELFFPWTLPHCRDSRYNSGWGWAWLKATDDFVSVVRNGVAAFAHGGRHPSCTLTAALLRDLDLERLRAYVDLCSSKSPRDIAGHSVPFMQLLLLLREFPRAEWTFLRYERLFELPGSEAVRVLARMFGLRLSNSRAAFEGQRRSCGFGSAAKSSTSASFADASQGLGEMESWLAPWHHEVLQLASAHPGARLFL